MAMPKMIQIRNVRDALHRELMRRAEAEIRSLLRDRHRLEDKDLPDDVTVQNQLLMLIRRLREEKAASHLLITHDLAVVANTCDRVIVMYAGREMEEAKVETLFEDPRRMP